MTKKTMVGVQDRTKHKLFLTGEELFYDDNETYLHEEGVESYDSMVAMDAYKHILSDVDTAGFTMEEVEKSLGTVPVCYERHAKIPMLEKRHLGILVDKGLLDYDSATKEYSVLRDEMPTTSRFGDRFLEEQDDFDVTDSGIQDILYTMRN